MNDEYDEFGFFDPFSVKEKEIEALKQGCCITGGDYAVSIQAVHEAITKWAGSEKVLTALHKDEVRSLLDSVHALPPVIPQPKEE